MEQSQYREVMEALQPLASHGCDPRASLLLAAALEGSGDLPAAEQALKHAGAVWPSNSSIAASLARLYLSGGHADQAAQALRHFQATPATPPRSFTTQFTS